MVPGRKRPDLLVRRVGGETIVYDRATHAAHCLGTLAAAVWRSWDGRASATEIAAQLEGELGEPVDPLAIEVAVRRLARAGLIDRPAAASAAAPDPPGDCRPAARREALRRVAALAGLAVASLMVPTPAAAAASCKPNWQFGDVGASRCQSGSECCSRCCSNFVDVCLNAPGIGGCH